MAQVNSFDSIIIAVSMQFIKLGNSKLFIYFRFKTPHPQKRILGFLRSAFSRLLLCLRSSNIFNDFADWNKTKTWNVLIIKIKKQIKDLRAFRTADHLKLFELIQIRYTN